jgi:hypothetical protein
MTVSLRQAASSSLFLRTATAMALSRDLEMAARLASHRWPDSPGVGLFLQRAATGATTTADNIGAGLILPGTNEFLALERARTVLGRLNRWRSVPLSDGYALATGGAVFSWVGEGAPVPVGRLAFSTASLPALKVGGLAIATKDLLRHASPAAEAAFRDELVNGAVAFLDSALLSADAASAGVSPAGLLAGVTATASTGDPVADLSTVLAEFTSLDGVAVVMSEANLVATALEAPGVIQNGTLAGIVPIIATSAAGTNVIAVHQPSVRFADEGRLQVATAQAAALEMDSEPTNDSATPTPTTLTSMWQTNSTALRLTRYLNWSAPAGSVAAISDADYAGVVS